MQQTSAYTPVDIHPAVSTATEKAKVIRTTIADDERLARERLRIFLASEPGMHAVAECCNGEETVAAGGHGFPHRDRWLHGSNSRPSE